MKKIPTLFERSWDGDRRVRDEVTPKAAWVVAGEGVATEKIDGTSCLWQRGLWKRRELKKGQLAPLGFQAAGEVDAETGKQAGWVLCSGKADEVWHTQALETCSTTVFVDGQTYELVGPKVQGNPYGLKQHTLRRHGDVKLEGVPRSFEELREWLSDHPFEGVVWHHADGRMAKIKRRDFGLEWPLSEQKGAPDVR